MRSHTGNIQVCPCYGQHSVMSLNWIEHPVDLLHDEVTQWKHPSMAMLCTTLSKWVWIELNILLTSCMMRSHNGNIQVCPCYAQHSVMSLNWIEHPVDLLLTSCMRSHNGNIQMCNSQPMVGASLISIRPLFEFVSLNTMGHIIIKVKV